MVTGGTLVVTLQAVTPLFMGGADPRGEPELRAPSVRGVLRYWLRAALGGVLGDQDLGALRRAETEVFGSTDGTGAVGIRASWHGLRPVAITQNVLPHASAKRAANLRGFREGSSIELRLTHRGVSEVVLWNVVGALLLAVSFGGLGRRCRRGWGTVRFTGFQPGDCAVPRNLARWLVPSELRSPPEWLTRMRAVSRDVSDAVRDLVRELRLSTTEAKLPSQFPLLAADTQLYVWDQPFPNGETAIGEFHEREHQFMQKEPQHARAFGYAGNRRQASPLWVRIFPVQAQGKTSFYVGMCLLQPAFQGANYEALRRFIESWPTLTAKGERAS